MKGSGGDWIVTIGVECCQCTEYTVYTVLCTVYSVQSTQCTVYRVHSVHCTVYTVICTLDNHSRWETRPIWWLVVQCSAVQCSAVQCTLYTVNFTLYNIQFTVYCTVYSVQCTVYSAYNVQCNDSSGSWHHQLRGRFDHLHKLPCNSDYWTAMH